MPNGEGPTLAERMTYVREALGGQSKQAFSLRLGLSRNYVQKVEATKIKEIGRQTEQSMAERIGAAAVSYLVNGGEPPSEQTLRASAARAKGKAKGEPS